MPDWDLPEGQTHYSEVDELRGRLAEVTAQLARLLDAVEEFDAVGGWECLDMAALTAWNKLFALADEIRKNQQEGTER